MNDPFDATRLVALTKTAEAANFLAVPRFVAQAFRITFDPPTALALLAALTQAHAERDEAQRKATQLFDALEKTERALESKYNSAHLLQVADAELDGQKAVEDAIERLTRAEQECNANRD